MVPHDTLPRTVISLTARGRTLLLDYFNACLTHTLSPGVRGVAPCLARLENSGKTRKLDPGSKNASTFVSAPLSKNINILSNILKNMKNPNQGETRASLI